VDSITDILKTPTLVFPPLVANSISSPASLAFGFDG
jgi:hypothetical protein